MKKQAILLAALVALTACTKEDLQSAFRFGAEGTIGKVTASFEAPQAKATFSYDFKQQVWETGDEISVSTKSFPAAKFTLTEGADTPEGTFESQTPVNDTTVYYAVSPYSAIDSISWSKSGDAVWVEYPSKESFDNAYCAEGANIMVARSSGTTFYFRNACAYIELVVNGPEDDLLNSVVIKSRNGKIINGQAKITFDADGKPQVAFTDKGTDSNVITFFDEHTGGVEFGLPIDIAVPPVFTDGFSITVITANGAQVTKTSDNAVVAGDFIVMPEFAVEAVTDAAQIGEFKYKTLQAAFDAAAEMGSDCTVTLLRDCSLPVGTHVKEGAAVTLDLNGKTITEVAGNRLYVDDWAKLTIDDSSLEKGGAIIQTDTESETVSSAGGLTIKEGEVKGGCTAVRVNSGYFILDGGILRGTHNLDGAVHIKTDVAEHLIDSVILNGGKVISTGRAVMVDGCKDVRVKGTSLYTTKKVVFYLNDGNAAISGGKFISEGNNPLYNTSKGYGSITGGYFYTDNGAIVYGSESGRNSEHVSISGGYFGKSISYTAYLKTGYQQVSCEVTDDEGREYHYTVEKAAAVQATLIRGDGSPVEYSLVTDALKMAVADPQNCFVKLLADCSLSEQIQVAGNNVVTIDLNGYTLTSQGDKRLVVNGEQATLKVLTSREGGAMTQTSKTNYAVSQTAGKFIVESGLFKHTPDATTYTIYSTGGDMEVNGGEIWSNNYRTIWKSNGDFVMTGGKIWNENTSDTDKPGALYLTTKANATITGGEISSLYAYGADLLPTCVIKEGNFKIDTIYGGASVTIESGTFSNIVLQPTSAGIVNIKGGFFSSTDIAPIIVDGPGTVNISGGEFTASGAARCLKATDGVTNVTGGRFTAGYKLGTISVAGGTVNIEDAEVFSTEESSRCLYVGDGNSTKVKGTLNINGGKFHSEYTMFYGYSGVLNVTGGTFISKSGVFGGNTYKTVTSTISGGYFSSESESTTAIFTSAYYEGTALGGRFDRSFDAKYIKKGYVLDNSDPVTVEGIEYPYQIIESPDAPDVASVNGEAFKSFDEAFDAAVSYSGSGDVTLKLETKDTIFLNRTMDFTNQNGKSVTLDLNKGVLRGTVDSLITTTGVLTIKDGTVSSNKRKAITLLTKGTVNLDNCFVFNDRVSYASTNSLYSVICIKGTNSSSSGTVNIYNGSRVFATNWFNCIYVTYGYLNTENCEITGGINYKSGDSYGQSYFAAILYTGAKVKFNEGTSILSPGTKYAPVYITTGNATYSSIEINGGWYYGELKSISESTSGYASRVLTINGGRFSHDCSFLNPMGGKTFTGCSEKHVHNGVEYTYSFKVE